jgi:acetolactate synthase I/II/III large subunit
MTVGQIIAEVMKRERITTIPMYAVTAMSEVTAAVDIRPIIVRQERVAAAMCDCQGRQSCSDDVKVVSSQTGPGVENMFGSIAQSYKDGAPLVYIFIGPGQSSADVYPTFNPSLNFHNVTKTAEVVSTPAMAVPALRRAFTLARNGRPGPCMVEIRDCFNQEHPTIKTPADLDYAPTRRSLMSPDPKAIDAAADALLKAKMPLIYVGQGVHYAKAWPELMQVAELLEAPVCTSMEGKSAFPETHPLACGSGGPTMTRAVAEHVRDSDVVFGAGVSFGTGFAIVWPTQGKQFIHLTVDERDLNKVVPAQYPILSDAKLGLAMMYQALSARLKGKPRGLAKEVAARIAAQNGAWLKEWWPYLTSNAKPLSPYRVIYDLLQTVDVPNTIITHDAGSPRNELVPFWKPVTPLSYTGWGRELQLGHSLGLTMGAKLAHPEKLCMNWWGDAAIGMTGFDFETCVRCNIPIMSIVSINHVMKTELAAMKLSHEKYRTCDIGGNYADFAKAMGGYGERVTEPDQIVHAIKNGIAATQKGTPALLEFITTDEVLYSTNGAGPSGSKPGGDD